ncbi:MAG: hypothetical protein IKR94_05820, partial [Bacteroidales bacterium]|nr:hypothetical protein [Bacteroidales bacterium]
SHNVLKLSRREELSLEELKKGDQRKFKYTPKTASDIFPKYYLIRINSYRKIVADAIDEWMTFLKDNSIKEDTKVPGLIEAKEQLKISKMTPAERLIYDRHLDAVELEVDALTNSEREGEQRGIKKGIAQGRQETLLAIARQMKEHGDNIDYIMQLTGLTQDDINNL